MTGARSPKDVAVEPGVVLGGASKYVLHPGLVVASSASTVHAPTSNASYSSLGQSTHSPSTQPPHVPDAQSPQSLYPLSSSLVMQCPNALHASAVVQAFSVSSPHAVPSARPAIAH